MNIVLDVNIVVDICARRDPFYDDSLAAVLFSKTKGRRIWLYVGAVQTMEYTLGAELKRRHPAEAAPISNSAHGRKAKELLQEFAQDKNWLAALAGEGDVFSSSDPEDEQFIKSLDRFPPEDVIFLTRDNPMLNGQDPRVLSPVQFLEKFAPPPQDETRVHAGSKPIDFIDLKTQQDLARPGLEIGIHRVLHHGQYIMGPEVRKLEENLAAFTGSAHAVTCASGTDALLIALLALDIGPGDEVITVPYTWISTAEVIALLRASPVFVDIDPDTFNMEPARIEAAITPNTRAIMPVSIYGQCADMTRINRVAETIAARCLSLPMSPT